MKKTLLLVLILIIQGCSSNKETMYEWGSYEDLIYKNYSHPEKFSPNECITKLTADYEIAKSKNKAIPPGYYAQLGIFYYQDGKPDLAEKSLSTEMEIFPESKQFMIRLIDQIKKRRAL